MPLDPSRVVARLRELQELTGDEDGAQRVAWTETWRRGRAWLAESLADLPLENARDPAGNDWYTLRGELRAGGSARRAHGLGAERRLARRLPERARRRRGAPADRRGGNAARDRPARRLGRRGGRALRPLAVRLVRRRRLDGRPGRAAAADRPRRRRAAGRARARTASTSTARSKPARSSRAPPPTSSCTSSRGRCSSRSTSRSARCSARSAWSGIAITWRGQAAHAGSTPMEQRRDALAGAAKLALEIRDIARETGDGAVCTSGGVVCKPGIVTSVVETAEQLLDQRHLDADKLASMLARGEGSERALRRGGADRRRVGADLADRADPLRRDAGRLRRRGDRRGRRDVAPASLRPAARRRRGRPCGRAHGDGLRPEPARPLAHEARGHEARASRAGRGRARPAGDEDDRLGRSRRRSARAEATPGSASAEGG